jgi:hypothetical protein
VPIPKDRNLISVKWVFALKTDKDGNITKYKARLCTRGFTQVPGIDFQDTYAPVASSTSIRVFLAYAALNNLDVRYADFVAAFLNGSLQEELYLTPPFQAIHHQEEHACGCTRQTMD